MNNPPHVATALALFADVQSCAAAVTAIVEAGLVPRCLELLDAATLDAVRANRVAIDPRAKAMLLIEVDGEEVEADRALERLGELLAGRAGVVDVVVAQDAAQRARLWEARRALSPATRKLAKYKLSEDVVVPRTKIVDLLAEVERIGERTGVRHLTYGHAGDGNLHVQLPLERGGRARGGRARDRGADADDRGARGTLSGEHGIGVSKAAYLPIEQSAELISVQRDLKRVFDPKELLNPGKIFPARGHGGC